MANVLQLNNNSSNPTAQASGLGVIDQIRVSLLPKNRAALATGLLLGGIVPTGTYVIGHFETQVQPLMWLLVAGGLMYSAKTVFDWAKIAFKEPLKALGFVILIEGVMTFSHTLWLSYAALAYLIAINGIATGCNLVNDQKQAAKAKKGGRR